MARGWEHLAKEESLRQMGFITLSSPSLEVDPGSYGGGCWEQGGHY